MKLTSRQAGLINEMLCEDASRVVRGRELRNAALNEVGGNFDLPLDTVMDRWPNELDDAFEFVSCAMRVDDDAAQGHVKNNWAFGTLEHEGETYLLARDEATDDSLAYKDDMGGWYRRLGDNDASCRQTGSKRGVTSSARASAENPTKVGVKSGTRVSGESVELADSIIFEMLHSERIDMDAVAGQNLHELIDLVESYAITVMGIHPDAVYRSSIALENVLTSLINGERM
jgi:hypothetical protein